MIMGCSKDVFIHLDKFSERHNLLHVGISFHDRYGRMRFDFRPNINDKSYMTSASDIKSSRIWIPDYKDEDFFAYRENRHIETRSIKWGSTQQDWDDILHFEKELSQRYLLGVYDCRHYVHHFTTWSTGKGTPIWSLHKLWKKCLN